MLLRKFSSLLLFLPFLSWGQDSLCVIYRDNIIQALFVGSEMDIIDHYPNQKDLSYFEEQIAKNQPKLYASNQLGLKSSLIDYQKKLSADFHKNFKTIKDSLAVLEVDSIPSELKVDSVLKAKGGIIDVVYSLKFIAHDQHYELKFNGTESENKWIIGELLVLKKLDFELCDCKEMKSMKDEQKQKCEEELKRLSQSQDEDFIKLLEELQNCP